MPKRSSKKEPNKRRDADEVSASIVEDATSDEQEHSENEGKNPAAVALGRLGGKKGGPARAKKLSKKRRSEIAKKAAQSRWKKGKSQ